MMAGTSTGLFVTRRITDNSNMSRLGSHHFSYSTATIPNYNNCWFFALIAILKKCWNLCFRHCFSLFPFSVYLWYSFFSAFRICTRERKNAQLSYYLMSYNINILINLCSFGRNSGRNNSNFHLNVSLQSRSNDHLITNRWSHLIKDIMIVAY